MIRNHDPLPPTPPPIRRRARALAVAFAAALAAASLAPLLHAAPAHADAADRGADLPFRTRQAEDADTNASRIGPDRTFNTLASEASGREAVRLEGRGDYVEFTLTEPANSAVVRYSIPDSADGSGRDDTLSLYVDGQKTETLDVTSDYAWYYGSYPFTNNPSAGNKHHFYDDVRTLLPDMDAGTTVRLQVDAGDTAPWYVVDLVDFEQVAPPKQQPADSLSVTEHGADPTGGADSSAAFEAAIAAAREQGREVWIPEGEYTITRHIIVDDVTIRGAGPWYSVLRGDRVGIYGEWAPQGSTNVELHDFAIFGEVTERVDSDQVNGIGGAIGGGSISNVWIEHTKVGMWFDGPFDGLTIRDCRLRNLTADGLNFRKGISNAVVENCHVRNSGDDGLAMWSHQQPDHDNAFRNNTVELPILANGIAIYGGADITVADNVVRDTLTQGGGLHVGNRHNAVPASGPITLARNTLVRTGVLDPNWQFGVGALWFYALDAPLDVPISVTDTEIVDSSYEALHFIGNHPITDVSFDNVNIDGAGTFALQLQSRGSASFSNVTATALGAQDVYDCQAANAFDVIDDGGNSGWDTGSTYCGPWPDPDYGGGSGDPDPDPEPEPPQGNVAHGQPVSAGSEKAPYVAGNAVDGDASSYWESRNGSFPQELTVDLGQAVEVDRIVLKLPPLAAWETRTQELSVLSSENGTDYTTLVEPAGYTFDPAEDNTVEIGFPATSGRYLRLHITGNTGWPAGQISEFEVHAA